jgi:hypothetical protein
MEKARRPTKRILYLDQNAISEMAKIGINDRVRTDYKKLLQLLHREFHGGRLAVLRSMNHEAETTAAGVLKDPIRKLFSSLSHTRLKHPRAIKEAQIVRAVWRCIGDGDLGPTINFDDAFKSNPDDPPSLFDINVDSDRMFEGEALRRADLAGKLDALRVRERNNGTTFDQLYKRELDAERIEIASHRLVHHIAARAAVSVQQVRDFTATNEFGDVPYVHLDVALTAKLLTHHSNRPIKPGDMPDFEALAAYLPYCDAFMTDKTAAAVAKAIAADTKYGCALFDATKSGVAAMISFLEERLEA